MQQVMRMISIVILIVLVGTLFFMLAEKASLLDAIYFTLTTVTTVGYGDVHPEGSAGKIVAIFLMLGGVGAILYIVSSVMSFVVEGRLRQVMGVRKMKRAIERMRGHFIVCGYGKLGKLVAQELEGARVPFVIVESNAQKVAEARDLEYAVVEGDATHQEVLAAAGLERSGGLATTISDDAENMYIGIAVRSICPQLPVVCRSSTSRVRKLFKRAGIDQIISTEEIGARRIVSSLTRPHIVEFMDELMRHEENSPSMHAIRLESGVPLIGQTIQGAKLRNKFDIVVLAIRRDGAFLPNPDPGEQLRAKDILILIGLPDKVECLRGLVEVRADGARVSWG
ncbi:MAG: potassium channel protein [Candidatus Eisenbacteria sp.]|nr:potassium channel protein [Candidatus Eisenbacteria bacterium]